MAKGCRVLYLETSTNPTLKVIDLERLTAAGHTVDAKVVVDNIFATPINTNLLALRCDLIIHNATKFLDGHADALGGVACGREVLVDEIFRYREINGASLHPITAYFLIRGMKDAGPASGTAEPECADHRQLPQGASVRGRRLLPRPGDPF